MITYDMVTGSFEVIGAISSWLNVWTYSRQRSVAGICWQMSAFYLAWSLWNCYFYPQMNMMVSFYAGLVILIANALWFGWVIFDKVNQRDVQLI